MLSDDVLLEIFNFCVIEGFRRPSGKPRIEEWITQAHVCRRWRSVVFHSPHRLNLRLLCSPKTPAKDFLDIWPPLPLIILDHSCISDEKGCTPGLDNIVAALEHNDRVCQIDLGFLTGSQLGYVTDSAAMQKPFPELTDLQLGMFIYGPAELLPRSFLGGTAPRLRSLCLTNIPFPGLPNLVLSATHLVNLSLYKIPRSGYIPPEVMATCLSALTSLESLHLQFQYPPPRVALETRRPPPPPLTRSILPSLTTIVFKGVSEYLEEILACIDAPRLDELHITFFNQIIFDTPQLFRFISQRPTLMGLERGHIAFNYGAIIVKFTSQTSVNGVLSLHIPCTPSEWQLSSLEQLCSSSLPLVSTLEDLYIFEDQEYIPRWQDDVENTLWLDLLRSFVAVKNLYVSVGYVPYIVTALQELVGGRTTEVLPALENVFLEQFRQREPLREGIEKFVAARQLISQHVAVSHWDRNSNQER
jgi:hypothetical protein